MLSFEARYGAFGKQMEVAYGPVEKQILWMPSVENSGCTEMRRELNKEKIDYRRAGLIGSLPHNVTSRNSNMPAKSDYRTNISTNIAAKLDHRTITATNMTDKPDPITNAAANMVGKSDPRVDTAEDMASKPDLRINRRQRMPP